MESQTPLKDLLISVTQFFKDSEAFSVFREKVIPRLFENEAIGAAIRVWISACATSKEVYSAAILV